MLTRAEVTVFVRYQSQLPHQRGIHVGVFGLANGLAKAGKLSDSEWAAWRAGNDWFNQAYPDPSVSHPEVYDQAVNPHAAAWFKATASHLLERVEPYLELLNRHEVRWVKLFEKDPGRIIYEDEVQFVVVPHEATK